MSKATTVQQTLTASRPRSAKDYTSTKDADKEVFHEDGTDDRAGKIRAELSETTKTANGAMDKGAPRWRPASTAFRAKISEQATKLDSTVKTANGQIHG